MDSVEDPRVVVEGGGARSRSAARRLTRDRALSETERAAVEAYPGDTDLR